MLCDLTLSNASNGNQGPGGNSARALFMADKQSVGGSGGNAWVLTGKATLFPDWHYLRSLS